MKEIDLKDILVLEDGEEYTVISKIVFEKSTYIYVVNTNDNKKIAEVIAKGDSLCLSEVSPKEKELLIKLMPLFIEDMKKNW